MGVFVPGSLSAEEPLHEGFSFNLGAGAGDRTRVESSIDLNLIPLPGGGSLNGTHIMFSLGATDFGDDVNLDRAHVQLLRWSHVRLAGIERDRDQGMPFQLEFGGVALPLSVVGKKESRNWIIAHIGLDAGLAVFRESFGAVEDAMATRPAINFRLDQQVDIIPRLSFRAWQKLDYAIPIGKFGDVDRIVVKQQLLFQGAAGLYLDVTRDPLYRDIPRTDPVTGEVSYRRSVNQGPRWRWMIFKASGHIQPFGYVTGMDRQLFLSTGVERRF